MINKIDIKEKTNNYYTLHTVIDLNSMTTTQVINDNSVSHNSTLRSAKAINDLVKTFTIYWESEYINNKIIDGNEVELSIYVDNEVIKYYFKNKFPDNYSEFRKQLNEWTGV